MNQIHYKITTQDPSVSFDAKIKSIDITEECIDRFFSSKLPLIPIDPILRINLSRNILNLDQEYQKVVFAYILKKTLDALPAEPCSQLGVMTLLTPTISFIIEAIETRLPRKYQNSQPYIDRSYNENTFHDLLTVVDIVFGYKKKDSEINLFARKIRALLVYEYIPDINVLRETIAQLDDSYIDKEFLKMLISTHQREYSNMSDAEVYKNRKNTIEKAKRFEQISRHGDYLKGYGLLWRITSDKDIIEICTRQNIAADNIKELIKKYTRIQEAVSLQDQNAPLPKENVFLHFQEAGKISLVYNIKGNFF